jgi:integrase
MPTENYLLMDGALHVYRRENSRYWQCSTYLSSRNHRQTTKEASLAAAKDFARDWYMERCVEDRQRRRGGVALLDSPVQPLTAGPGASTDGRRRQTPTGPSFEDAAKAFTSEFEIITLGERNADYVSSKSDHVRIHLLPFFGTTALKDITAGKVQEYRAHRQTSRVDQKTGKPKKPARATLHSEIVTLRQILKTANRKGWIVALPDMTAPYKTSGKISHRAWFSPDEYKLLYKATGERAKNPKKERWRTACEDMHDFVLFMVNSGLRPDEALHIQKRDIEIEQDGPNNERILHIAVRGKRGVGYCKTMPGAVLPFQRIVKRHNLKPESLLFPTIQRELFNAILAELNMKKDREGNPRTTYSLRHTYICFRLMEGADIYQIAKNCRTSVEMIEKYYAAHIKNMLDASAINVRKPKPSKKTSSRGDV